MSGMRKAIVIAAAAVLVFALEQNQLSAAWWDTNKIPTPPATQEVKRERRSIAGSEFAYIFYTSAQKADDLRNFYLRELKLVGWKEKDLVKDLGNFKLPGAQLESLDKFFKTNLLFEREDEELIISFVPSQYSRDGKTKFTVCQGKLPTAPVQPATGKIAFPELLDKPKKNVAPPYPGATLIGLSETKQALNATYVTQDNIEAVIGFYKTKMPGFGWDLIEEKPLEKLDMQGLEKLNTPAPCPTCPKKAFLAGSQAETWTAELNFTNQRGDLCKIGFSFTSVGTAKIADIPSLNVTTISVNYAEKTQ